MFFRLILLFMTKDRKQLNINIDPALLVKLKSKALSEGKTLTEFVTNMLEGNSIEDKSNNKFSTIEDKLNNKFSTLEERLLRVEERLKPSSTVSNVENTNENSWSNSSLEGTKMKSIFTDEGAKRYGETSRRLFQKHCNHKGISLEDGLKKMSNIIVSYKESNPELIFSILVGNHCLTGIEMTMAYKNGSCAMRSALTEFTDYAPLEELNDAFLFAVAHVNLVS